MLFKPSTIAQAAGRSTKWVFRRAVIEGLRRRPVGPARVLFEAPRGLQAKCAALLPRHYDLARLMRELHRAAAVLGFLRILDKQTYVGREAALEMTRREFVVIHKFSTVQLRRWVKQATQHGLAGLMDRRPGRSGRKARNRSMHAYRIARAHQIAVHLQSAKTPAAIAELLNIGEQTVKRDMRLLRLLGYELSFNRGTQLWTCHAPGRAKP
jgi:DNA-binding CsgD family transcriptional regulator